MPAAASINDAIANANNHATLANVANALLSTFTTWNTQWQAIFNAITSTEAERTVRNWAVQSQLVQNATPANGTIQEVQDVVNVVCRVLYATRAAQAATPARISAAQETAVLAAYNASWGTF
jgi:hypothetical protein